MMRGRIALLSLSQVVPEPSCIYHMQINFSSGRRPLACPIPPARPHRVRQPTGFPRSILLMCTRGERSIAFVDIEFSCCGGLGNVGKDDSVVRWISLCDKLSRHSCPPEATSPSALNDSFAGNPLARSPSRNLTFMALLI